MSTEKEPTSWEEIKRLEQLAPLEFNEVDRVSAKDYAVFSAEFNDKLGLGQMVFAYRSQIMMMPDRYRNIDKDEAYGHEVHFYRFPYLRGGLNTLIVASFRLPVLFKVSDSGDFVIEEVNRENKPLGNTIRFKIGELQAMAGGERGLVNVSHLEHGETGTEAQTVIVTGDEFLFDGSPLNPMATALAQVLTNYRYPYFLAGDVLFTSTETIE